MKHTVLEAALPFVLVVLVPILSSAADGVVFEGGISNLGGVELQEEFYLTQAKERGAISGSGINHWHAIFLR